MWLRGTRMVTRKETCTLYAPLKQCNTRGRSHQTAVPRYKVPAVTTGLVDP